MKILLLGYGKMGQIIEKLALKAGHSIVAKINIDNRHELDNIDPHKVDVAIEFTNPESAVANIKWCLERKIPVVVGTTGWLAHKAEVDRYCLEKNGTYFFASNFSIGVNLFFKVNKVLAKIMDKYAAYEPSMLEIHHTSKLDAPSGTAITLAEDIISQIDRKQKWGDVGNSETLKIESQRIDPAPGTHIVTYDSEVDSIEIKHTAHSRAGFAAGAVAVSEWIIDKKGCLTMNDFLSISL